jgi:hypothetical protein
MYNNRYIMNFENIEEIKNIMMDFTPLYKDVINNITTFLLPRFEEGKYYGEYCGTSVLYDAYYVLRRTRHYITLKVRRNRPIRKKIYLDEEGEYIKINKRHIIRASHYVDIIKHTTGAIHKCLMKQFFLFFAVKDKTKERIHYVNKAFISFADIIKLFKEQLKKGRFIKGCC